MRGECFVRCGDRNRRGQVDRIAVRPGGDCRERDRRTAELVRQSDRPPVARGEEVSFSLLPTTPDRADRVDHPACGKLAAARCLRVAGLAATEAAALLQDRRPTRTVDRAVDATAAEEAGVRRVDDRVDLLRGEIPAAELDHAYAGRGRR